MLSKILSANEMEEYKELRSSSRGHLAESLRLKIFATLYKDEFCRLVNDTGYEQLINKYGLEDSNTRYGGRRHPATTFNTGVDGYYFRQSLSLKKEMLNSHSTTKSIFKLKTEKLLLLIKELKIYLTNNKYALVLKEASSNDSLFEPYLREISIEFSHKRFLEKHFIAETIIQEHFRSKTKTTRILI